jgi:16S rRNA (guanine527-N7)-methyltransferase
MMDQASGGLAIVSRETQDTIASFENLVKRWNPAINLVSKASIHEMRDRHTLDSAQLFYLSPRNAGSWVDLGSGGGFPGLVVAILAKQERPDLKVTLVESDQRKATFLRQAIRTLELPATVLAERIEHVPPQSADVLSARALAPLVELLAHAERHLAPEGTAMFPKGARHSEEVAEARKDWEFDLDTHPSESDSQAAVLVIRNIKRA